MKSIQLWCDIILSLGIISMIVGWFISHSIITGNGSYGEHMAMYHTVEGWTLGGVGFSFILLSSLFKVFVKRMDAEMKSLRYKISKLNKNL